MELSVTSICRSCMTESSDMRSVFSTQIVTGNPTNLAEMLMACASVQIQYGDGLPIVICVSCIHQLNSAYTFKQRCEQTDASLREYLNNSECLKYEEIQVDEPEVMITEHCSIEVKIEDNDTNDLVDDTEIIQPEIVISKPKTKSSTIKVRKNRISTYASKKKLHKLKLQNSVKSNQNYKNRTAILQKKRKIKVGESKEEKVNEEPDHDETTTKSPETAPDQCSTTEDNLSCSVCKKVFTTSKYLLKHELSHKEDIQYECKFCNKMFNTRHSLYQHKKIHTKRYECKLCDKKFKSAHGLEYHTKRHNGIKDFICPIDSCQKRFTIKQALTKHLTLHSSEKKHLCSECGKAYSTNDALKYHVKQHLGQRPFLCMHCGKTFIQSCHLKDHMWIHNGVKPYKCQSCGNCYTSGHQLKKHLRRHCGKETEAKND